MAMQSKPLPEPERSETEADRLDRNLGELLQELRVAQTGVQVLFAFLLIVPFSARFEKVTDFQKGAYFTALVTSAAASLLLIAPTSFHRILFRLGQKRYMVEMANRLAVGGLAFLAVSMTAVMILITDVLFGGVAASVAGVLTAAAFGFFWYAIPIARRRGAV